MPLIVVVKLRIAGQSHWRSPVRFDPSPNVYATTNHLMVCSKISYIRIIFDQSAIKVGSFANYKCLNICRLPIPTNFSRSLKKTICDSGSVFCLTGSTPFLIESRISEILSANRNFRFAVFGDIFKPEDKQRNSTWRDIKSKQSVFRSNLISQLTAKLLLQDVRRIV